MKRSAQDWGRLIEDGAARAAVLYSLRERELDPEIVAGYHFLIKKIV